MVEPGGNCLHVGNHLGLHSLTVGQRASVGGLKSKPYVAGKHLVTKEMFVVEGENNPALFSHSFAVGDLQWTAGGAPWELRNTDADDDEDAADANNNTAVTHRAGAGADENIKSRLFAECMVSKL